MAPEICAEQTDETQTHQPSDGNGASSTVINGTMSNGAQEDANSEDLDYLAAEMPPGPPPTRENSLANRQNGNQGGPASLHTRLLGLENSAFAPDQPSTNEPNGSTTGDSSTTHPSSDQNENQQEDLEQDETRFAWGDGEADQETEQMWGSIFPDEGNWKVDVLEEVWVDPTLRDRMFVSVTVTVTEEPSN